MHGHSRNTLPLLTLSLLLGAVLAAPAGADQTARQPGVSGRVRGESRPLPSARVYAYELAALTLRKVSTDAQGNFLFQDLPAGLYKVIAHKAGFVPVVVPVTRATAQAYQFLELELAEQEPGASAGEDFWSIRARIPSDVLREIEKQELELASLEAPLGRDALSRFHTEMQAMTGVDEIAAVEGLVSGGKVGFEGKVGETRVGLRGRFWQFDSGDGSFGAARSAAVGGAQASALSLDVAHGPGQRLNVSGQNNRLVGRGGDSAGPVDFENYRVSWSQRLGERGQSDFAAQYTAESNYHRQGLNDPAEIPEASRTWRLEGSYTTSFGPRSTLQTGLRYRERQYGLVSVANVGETAPELLAELPGQAHLDLYGRGGVRLQPAVLVQYGLYTTLSDGSLAMTPQGGVVLQLGKAWQMETSVSRRAYEDAAARIEPDFFPTLYQESDLCEEGSESCYELSFTRRAGEENAFSLGAVHRVVGETLRLYFSDDFFDRLESLYLVPGDELPEVRMSVSRRLSPGVVTTLESSVAQGGGGMFHGRDRQAYENRVRYMVTSLDTRFQGTSTGVYLAFHHLNQELEPVGAAGQAALEQSDLERLQLVLTQDLNVLLDIAPEWALQLNMELSRGALPQVRSSEELRKRFLGGIAVRF